MSNNVAIHWFRQDLRLSDNLSLNAAAEHGCVLPIYILDDDSAGAYAMGRASRSWLHHSLQSLHRSVNHALSIYQGDPISILMDLVTRYDVKAVYWNRCYEPWRMNRDTKIKKELKAKGINTKTYNGSLIWEPWTIKKNDGTPYKVFTPFYHKGCLESEEPRQPASLQKNLKCLYDQEKSLNIDELKLLPKIGWHKKLEPHWKIGEDGAKARFKQFVEEQLVHYKEGRNIPSKPYVSRLSPHLHFGEISPKQLWHTVRGIGKGDDIDHFCSELGWREFSYSQLYHAHDLPIKNLQPKFDQFPWVNDKRSLKAWQKGQTGIPMVDAGMRELWQTGYMHNRLRMIVGSFLVKNLRIDWRHGERWFWDTLFDADLASNSASWQWVAGSGADAAPYFRIFNPVTQGQKFDPDGSYVRRFVPEIKSLPDNYLFNPWEAPTAVLKKANVELGRTYPKPIVDLKQSRNAALKAFESLKKRQI